MDLTLPPGAASELPAALLQAVVAAGLAAMAWSIHRRAPRDYLRWWTLTWGLYTVRMGAILGFFVTESPAWLFWHQVLTGWTALALLGAALAFGRPGLSRRPLRYAALFPVVWSYVAIYRLDQFLLAAGPAVAFLSLATAGAAWAFWFHHRRIGSHAARFLGITLLLWALHHLDYPFLRARGAWAPWGYYLDILLQGATGFGILLLALEDHRTGLRTLSGLAARILERPRGADFTRTLLEEICLIPGVDGAVLIRDDGLTPLVTEAVGTVEARRYLGSREAGSAPPGAAGRSNGVTRVKVMESGGPTEHIAIPVASPEGFRGRLVVAGRGRHGLVALGDTHLLATGQQVGIALDTAALTDRLLARTRELEALAARTVGEHEAERRRISRELHDETAQALAAVRMRLALLGEELGPEAATALESAAGALKEAIASIRRVTARLRPVVLDELGLVPALRALTRDFADSTDVTVSFDLDGEPPPLPADHELTLYRCLQEGLSNAMRHATGSAVRVRVTSIPDGVYLTVEDDGPTGAVSPEGGGPEFGTGLLGMKERVAQIGGTVRFVKGEAGSVLEVHVPRSGREG